MRGNVVSALTLVLALVVMLGCSDLAAPRARTERSAVSASLTAPESKIVGVRFRRAMNLRDWPAPLGVSEEGTLRVLGGTIIYRFRAFPAALVLVNTSTEWAIRSRPDVAFVISGGGPAAFSDIVSWQRPSSGANFVATGEDATGVGVGVVDSGVECGIPDLQNACGLGWNFVPDGYSWFQDPYGHGTRMAALIAARLDGQGTRGVARGAIIRSYRVLNANGSDDTAGGCAAIAAAVDQAVYDMNEVISLSIGHPDTPYWRQQCALLESAVQFAWSAGIVVVAAAGNFDGQYLLEGDPIVLPAAYDRGLAVTGVMCTEFESAYAECESHVKIVEWNQGYQGALVGPLVTVAAPARDVISTGPNGQAQVTGGTSAATALVSAAVALVIARYPDAAFQADALRAHIRETGTGFAGYNYLRHGGGLLDAGAALATNPCSIYSCYPHPIP